MSFPIALAKKTKKTAPIYGREKDTCLFSLIACYIHISPRDLEIKYI